MYTEIRGLSDADKQTLEHCARGVYQRGLLAGSHAHARIWLRVSRLLDSPCAKSDASTASASWSSGCKKSTRPGRFLLALCSDRPYGVYMSNTNSGDDDLVTVGMSEAAVKVRRDDVYATKIVPYAQSALANPPATLEGGFMCMPSRR